jgi:alkanesulfonate monooxygenase SsuD/methylene tetrahydromethanopterin reductase-like flavin-dependent oxidoreductase (luciferase family)
VLAHHGFEANADEIRAAWRRGDGAGMAAAVSDEMLTTIAIAGTPAEVRSQYENRRAGLFERTLLWTPLGGLDAVRTTIAAFGDTARAGDD